MGFGGGGSGALPNHEHTNIPLSGGPLDFANTTIASLTANSMTYSDGVALQELTIGSDAQVLAVSGGAPRWITNTSNPLVKVTKTFADITALEMDIYTLPQDAALVNVYTDITTVFDISTAVTIGDAGDDNGFQEASDFTSGTGLTSATRGAYVTSFKTMRSTSGTTAIKAYNFTTSGTPIAKDAQDTTSDTASGTDLTISGFTVAGNSNRVLVVCTAVADHIREVSGITWNGVENFTRAVFNNGINDRRCELWYLVNPTATTADVVTTWSIAANNRGVGVYSYYNVDQTTPVGVTATANGSGTTSTGTITPTSPGSLIVDSDTQASASTDTLTAGWTNLVSTRSYSSQYNVSPSIGVSNNMFYTYASGDVWTWCAAEIIPSTVGTDTQGVVDFYLQVVD